MKRQSKMYDPRIVSAHRVFPGRSDLEGKFVAIGVCGDDERFGFTGEEIRTSLLVKIDIENGEIETLNTIYKII